MAKNDLQEPMLELGPPKTARSWIARATGFNEFGVVVALVLIFVVVASFHPRFLEPTSLANVVTQCAYFGIIALGMVFMLTMREIDLSVGSNFGLCMVGSSVMMREGVDPWLAALAAILLGTLLGAVNGVLANVLKVSTIIVTLGTLSMFRGITLVVSDTRVISGLPREHPFFTIFGEKFLGLPVSAWALVVLVVVLQIVYRRTRFGFVVRAVGSNPEAAELAGISIERVRLQALMLTGCLCGFSAALAVAYFASADPNAGTGYELLVIAAAIIGGTGLAGGTGTVVGAFLGALVIALIRSGLVQFGVTPSWSIFVTGAVIVAAVALDVAFRRRKTVRL